MTTLDGRSSTVHRWDWIAGTAESGTRGGAAWALYVLVAIIDRQQRIEGLTMPAVRLGALIRALVREPMTGR